MGSTSCAACGHANNEGMRFCVNCGAALKAAAAGDSRTCAACGYVNEEGVRFCGECGKPLGGAAASAPVGPRISLAKESYGQEDGNIVVKVSGIPPRMLEEGGVYVVLCKPGMPIDQWMDQRGVQEFGESEVDFEPQEIGGEYEMRLFRSYNFDDETLIMKAPFTVIGIQICQACGHSNPPGRKFCGSCGGQL